MDKRGITRKKEAEQRCLLHRAKQHLKSGQITTKVEEEAALGNLRNPKPREEGGRDDSQNGSTR